jgi:hypothetical protein
VNLLRAIPCIIGRHHRDYARSELIDGKFRSVCTGCGVAMVRNFAGWRIDRSSAGS